jgi:hypothetical protein
VSFRSVPDTLKEFYGLDYLYNVLPLDVVGDTFGAVFGKRRVLKALRQLYRNGKPEDWRRLLPAGAASDVVFAFQRLVRERVTVSQSRQGEPITLAPLSRDLIAEGQGDKPVQNAFRAIGNFGAKLFTPEARRLLAERVSRWEQQPLARLAVAIVDYADGWSAGPTGKADAARTAPPVPPSDDPHLRTAQEDVERLLAAWDRAPFGPEQQLDQLRTLLCFHITLHLFATAGQRLEHRADDEGFRPFFLCDAAQTVGSSIARPAYHSLVLWMGRLREGNHEICWRSARSLRTDMKGLWRQTFEQLAEHRGAGWDAAVVDTARGLLRRLTESGRRKATSKQATDFERALSDELTPLFEQAAGTGGQAELFAAIRSEQAPLFEPRLPTDAQLESALARAMLTLYGGRSRTLDKVFDCIRAVGDGAGFIGPKGTHQRKRFLLRADLLEVLAVVHLERSARGEVASDEPSSVDALLTAWFERYGIVVDASRPEVVAAVDGGRLDARLMATIPDASLSAENHHELEDRLIELRLARRYSDASVCLDESALQRGAEVSP